MKVGFWGALALIFITLKLTNMITWSWWIVLAPLLAGPVLALIVFLLAIVMVLVDSTYRRYR